MIVENIPTQYTLTIKSIDRQEIDDTLKANKYKIALQEIREKLRKLNKYNNLEEWKGNKVFDHITDEFWRTIGENEINID